MKLPDFCINRRTMILESNLQFQLKSTRQDEKKGRNQDRQERIMAKNKTLRFGAGRTLTKSCAVLPST
jgi:hypothetical protein